jgi:hypothetical protein
MLESTWLLEPSTRLDAPRCIPTQLLEFTYTRAHTSLHPHVTTSFNVVQHALKVVGGYHGSNVRPVVCPRTPKDMSTDATAKFLYAR